MPPHQTSPRGFAASARIWANVSPEPLGDSVTFTPVARSNSVAASWHQSTRTLQ